MLLPADESFHHQIVEPAAYVAVTDRAWTEKVCAMAASRDGRFQLGLGVGKYTNRNVFDGYAGLSVGRQQWTVRSSRRLADDPASTSVGPICYEVLEPMQTVRFSLADDEALPLSFEWTFTSVVPPVLEQRDRQPSRRGFRTDIDILRYHQVGRAEGWFTLDGERTRFGTDEWLSTRDHSWGVRQDVGRPAEDVEGAGGGLGMAGVSFRFSWSPMLLERADGSAYAIHHQHRQFRAFGWEETTCEGTVEEPDGRVERVAAVRPELRFDPLNRRVLGGTIHLTMTDGSARPLHVEAMGDTGFQLGLGLYFGLDGHHHGEWRGRLHVEGEHTADCAAPETARRIHQIRDAVMRVNDPVGGGHGWGNLQTAVIGAWPDEGLDEESSFV